METQLWGGKENNIIQLWELTKMYSGSKETAPYKESTAVGSGVMCLVGDEGSKAIWSGHKDGRIQCWKLDSGLGLDPSLFKEVLSWVSHYGPILSMIIASYDQ